jgi:hypothetical protein
MRITAARLINALAVVIIVACLWASAALFLRRRIDEPPRAEIERAAALVADANQGLPPLAPGALDYAGRFERNMERTDRPLPRTALTSWEFHPQPGFTKERIRAAYEEQWRSLIVVEGTPKVSTKRTEPVAPPATPGPPAKPEEVVEVQLRFRNAESDLKHAWIPLRRFLPGRVEPVRPQRQWGDPRRYFSPRFAPGDRLRAKWAGRHQGETTMAGVDSGLVLEEIREDTRLEVRTREVPKVNPLTGLVEIVEETYTVEVKEIFAVLRDPVSGEGVKLPEGSSWWPARSTAPAAP